MTMGANGNVSVVLLPGRHQPAISCLDNYSPNGSETQRCGVRIDPPIFPTPEGALAGRDEVLERALQPASAQFPDGRPFAAAPAPSGRPQLFLHQPSASPFPPVPYHPKPQLSRPFRRQSAPIFPDGPD